MKRKDIALGFDFDGTLAETMPITLEAAMEAFLKLGLEIPSQSEIEKYLGPAESGFFMQLNPTHGGELFKTYLEIYEKKLHSGGIELFEGTKDLLFALKDANVNLALITGKSRESGTMSLKFLGIFDLFDIIEFGGTKGSVKEQKLNEISAKWGISPENIYYAGDIPQDVIDSNNAGCISVAAGWSKLANEQALRAQSPKLYFKKASEYKDYIISKHL